MELSALSAIPLSSSVYVGSAAGSKIDLTYSSNEDLSTNLSCIMIGNTSLYNIISVLVLQIVAARDDIDDQQALWDTIWNQFSQVS